MDFPGPVGPSGEEGPWARMDYSGQLGLFGAVWTVPDLPPHPRLEGTGGLKPPSGENITLKNLSKQEKPKNKVFKA